MSTTGLVFDIHHYAVHDGPGIRTLVFLKGCPLACAWCCNPESQSRRPTLMHSEWRCGVCGTCARACPHGAVTLGPEGPAFARDHCAACEAWACHPACPREAITRSGTPMDADAVVARIAKDLPYYVNSGGGATFSGGEPFLQPAFLLDLLRGCRTQGIHTAVETCGHARRADLLGAEPLVDLFLYDLKLMDPGRHLAATGVDNALILDNLAALAARVPDRVVVRLALIPGCTDDDANLDAVASFMVREGLPEVNLEPFHPMGIDKYKASGRAYGGPVQLDPHYGAQVEAAQAVFTARGLRCEVV